LHPRNNFDHTIQFSFIHFLKTLLVMPKMKSKSSAKKRFTFTGTGKIKRRHAYKSHILTKKSKKRKRNLGYFTIVDSADVQNVKGMLSK